MFTIIQTTPSDEETHVKAGDYKHKLGQIVSPNTIVLSQPSSIRHRHSLPNLVQLDVTCSIDNKINLSKLTEDTIKNPSLSDVIRPDIIQAVVSPLVDNIVESPKETNLGKAPIICRFRNGKNKNQVYRYTIGLIKWQLRYTTTQLKDQMRHQHKKAFKGLIWRPSNRFQYSIEIYKHFLNIINVLKITTGYVSWTRQWDYV